jgi:hypothetical protein
VLIDSIELIELPGGFFHGPDVERTTFEEMAAMIVNDYKANHRRSLTRLEDAIAHLREFFADYRAVEITGDKVTDCSGQAVHREIGIE